MQRGLLAGITLGVAMVIFTLQNEVKVPVKILWIKFAEVPLALILLISLLIGVSITAGFSFVDKQRLRARIKRLQAKIKTFEDPSAEGEVDSQEANDLNRIEGMITHGEPGHKFFDD